MFLETDKNKVFEGRYNIYLKMPYYNKTIMGSRKNCLCLLTFSKPLIISC